MDKNYYILSHERKYKNLKFPSYPKVEEKSSSLGKFEVNLNPTIRQILQNRPTKMIITEAPKFV